MAKRKKEVTKKEVTMRDIARGQPDESVDWGTKHSSGGAREYQDEKASRMIEDAARSNAGLPQIPRKSYKSTGMEARGWGNRPWADLVKDKKSIRLQRIDGFHKTTKVE